MEYIKSQHRISDFTYFFSSVLQRKIKFLQIFSFFYNFAFSPILSFFPILKPIF